jgi:hypothetical protein
MRQKKIEVKTFKTILTCAKEDCPGNYEFEGEVNIMHPKEGALGIPVFFHKCTVCGDEQHLEKKFPILSCEEI